MSIEIETSSDTVEEVQEAFGSAVEIEESQPEEGEEQTPAEEPGSQEGETTEVGETETDEEREEREAAEAEAAEAAEAGKTKKAPTTVPVSRLNQKIREVQRLRQQLAERREPEPKPEPVAERPLTFSSKTEPTIEDYLNKPDKYPDPYSALVKDHGTWVREETRAEMAYEQRQAEAKAQFDAQTELYREVLPEALKRYPDYAEVTNGSKVNISENMKFFAWDSEIGPDLLYHFALNPEAAEEIASLPTARRQNAAMEALEETLKAAITEEFGEPAKAKPGAKKTVAVPLAAKPKQKMPPPEPTKRLKPAGPGPRSLRELAGPEGSEGIDIDYSPEYAKAVKAQRRT